jgi:hypothetical protein
VVVVVVVVVVLIVAIWLITEQVSIPGTKWTFSFAHYVLQNDLGTHPVSYLIGIGGDLSYWG